MIQVPDKVKTLLNEYNPDVSLASWAIRFAASHDGILAVLSGMSSLEQLEDNTSYMQDFKPLTDGEFELLKKAADIIRSNTAIACTNCRYCTTECLKKIAIPDYFALYNNMKRLHNVGYIVNQQNYYINLIQTYGKPSDCIKCGVCEKNCPQHLKIRNLLEQISETFENIEQVKFNNTNTMK